MARLSPKISAVSRVGFGYDIHRFEPGRKFILGGVRIAHGSGLLGHSDADVLLHAICEALLGAAALGDIGKHFPDSSKKFKNISSLRLLSYVEKLVEKNNFRVLNVDSTIVLEAPKIGKHVPSMQRNIARTLGIRVSQVSIKATTNEGLGSLGRREGCAAYAVVSIIPGQNG